VKQDPRFNIPDRENSKKYSALKKIESMISKTEQAVSILRDSKKIADNYTKDLKEADKEKYEESIKLSKAMSDSLSTMMDQFIGKEDKRQGITLDYNVYVTDRIRLAQAYVGNQMGVPSATETDLIEKAEVALKEQLEKVNNFFKNEWVDYRKEMETIKISPFKDYEPIE
ncbi:MAG: hypothetical protein WBA74_09295, partial [Cyclobacteriaceae bacterium]